MTELTEQAQIEIAGSNLASEEDRLQVLAKAKSAGFPVTEAFTRFVDEYCGRHFRHPAFSPLVDSSEKIHFDISALGSDFDPEATEEYSERLGSALIPVGESNNGHLMLMIDGAGALYGAYDRYFTKLGNNIEDGLNAIFERRETPSIT
jgi:SUKH-3 immunity protein